MDVSIVIPIHNERENIPLLYDQLNSALAQLNRTYEILLVDDGSTDGSHEQLVQLAARDSRVKVVQFRRNYGQTAGMQAGSQWGRRRYCDHDGRGPAKRSRRHRDDARED